MNEKINLKSVIAALIILIAGLVMAFGDVFWWHSPSSLVLGIGCSLLASALVSLLTTILLTKEIAVKNRKQKG